MSDGSATEGSICYNRSLQDGSVNSGSADNSSLLSCQILIELSLYFIKVLLKSAGVELVDVLLVLFLRTEAAGYRCVILTVYILHLHILRFNLAHIDREAVKR